MSYLPAPHKITLVRHQDDRLGVADASVGQVGEHHLRCDQGLLVIHRHHHQHRARIIDVELSVQRHFSILVINEHQSCLIIVNSNINLFAHTII